MLTSAKKGNNIENLFEDLARKYLEYEFIKKVEEMKSDRGEVTKITKENVQKEKKEK